MEKERDNFLEKLKKLVDLAKTKQNALDITEINDFLPPTTCHRKIWSRFTTIWNRIILM